MTKRNLGLILALSGMMMFGTTAHAGSPFQLGLRLGLAIPQNEFAEQLDALGFGGDINFLANIPNTPLHVGLDVNFLVYGSETREEQWSYTIPDLTLKVTTTNSIVQPVLLLRLQSPSGIVRPYVDGCFGLNYLSTSTSVKSEWSDDDDNEIASSTNYEDTAMCYGLGAGIQFKVWDGAHKKDPENKLEEFMIDVGVRYIGGGEADYLKKGDIERYEDTNGHKKVRYNPSHSTTDLLTIHLGVTFGF